MLNYILYIIVVDFEIYIYINRNLNIEMIFLMMEF